MSNSGVPYSCPTCRAEGSPTGQLVFEGSVIPPICKYHSIPMERSIYYNEQGERIQVEEIK